MRPFYPLRRRHLIAPPRRLPPPATPEVRTWSGDPFDFRLEDSQHLLFIPEKDRSTGSRLRGRDLMLACLNHLETQRMKSFISGVKVSRSTDERVNNSFGETSTITVTGPQPVVQRISPKLKAYFQPAMKFTIDVTPQPDHFTAVLTAEESENLAIRSPVFWDMESRRHALDNFYHAVGHAIRQKQFPQDTVAYDHVTIAGEKVEVFQDYPEEQA